VTPRALPKQARGQQNGKAENEKATRESVVSHEKDVHDCKRPFNELRTAREAGLISADHLRMAVSRLRAKYPSALAEACAQIGADTLAHCESWQGTADELMYAREATFEGDGSWPGKAGWAAVLSSWDDLAGIGLIPETAYAAWLRAAQKHGANMPQVKALVEKKTLAEIVAAESRDRPGITPSAKTPPRL